MDQGEIGKLWPNAWEAEDTGTVKTMNTETD